MKKLNIVIISLITLLFISNSLSAQITQEKEQDNIKKNLAKINLFALPVRTISLQYERVILKFLSVAITGKYMWKGSLPYKTWIYNNIGNGNADFKNSLDNMTVSNFAFSPEVRFYMGKKGFGRGFYIAPSYKFANLKIDNFIYTYTGDNNTDESLTMSGNMTANYGGLMIGAQWEIWKNFTLDWWIIAPFAGIEKTDLSGTIQTPLSEDIQKTIKENIESIDMPLTTITADVYEYGATIHFKGFVPGISAGLAIGFKF